MDIVTDQITFLDCPALLAGEGTVRCGLPAEVRYRFIMNSTDGPLESAVIRCPAGHFFNGPIDCLTFDKQPTAGGAAARFSSRPRGA